MLGQREEQAVTPWNMPEGTRAAPAPQPHSFLNEHLSCPVSRLTASAGPTLPPGRMECSENNPRKLGQPLLCIYEYPSRGQTLQQEPKGGRADCVPVPSTVTRTSTVSSEGEEEALSSRYQLPTQSHLIEGCVKTTHPPAILRGQAQQTQDQPPH